jgi:hypothetical protein
MKTISQWVEENNAAALAWEAREAMDHGDLFAQVVE